MGFDSGCRKLFFFKTFRMGEGPRGLGQKKNIVRQSISDQKSYFCTVFIKVHVYMRRVKMTLTIPQHIHTIINYLCS
jgi:hypothetical protein